MAQSNDISPLLGYNTNVRHDGKLFHIQTEDSGVGHPHVITHLFTEGTILATKKESYADVLDAPDRKDRVRAMMKDLHKTMFIELRDGAHDEIVAKIFGAKTGELIPEEPVEPKAPPEVKAIPKPKPKPRTDTSVRVMTPANMSRRAVPSPAQPKPSPKARSLFDTPNANGDFGTELISDKSLDEVILSYLTEEELGD